MRAQRPVTHALTATNLTIAATAAGVLDHVSVEINPGETVAIVGESGSGGEYLVEAFGRVLWPDSGRVAIDGQDLLELPESVTGRRIAYAGSDTYFFHGTLRDNILYGLKHAPMTTVEYEGAEATKFKWSMIEARRAGNPEFDLNSDWVDYASTGATGPGDLYSVMRPVLDAGCVQDLLDAALRSTIDSGPHEDLTSRIVELRQALYGAERGTSAAGGAFEFTLCPRRRSENILFGTLKGP